MRRLRDDDFDEIARRVPQVVNHQRALRGWKPDRVLPSTINPAIQQEIEICPTVP